MSMWIYELLAPETLVRHLSLFLLVVAIGMPSMPLLRWFALASAVVAILLAVYTRDSVGIFWQALLIVVNVVQMWLARSQKFGRKLTAEEEGFRQAVVPTLTTGQVRRLLTAGRWVEAKADRVLIEQGQPTRDLIYIAHGVVDVVVDGARVAEVGPGSLLGEIGISTGEPATATTITATAAHLLEFDGERLRRLLETHPDLLDAVELAIQKSLREKLQRLNMAAAHGELP
jgi:hypothetical protein